MKQTFFKVIPRIEFEKLLQNFELLGQEQVDFSAAHGRILAEDIKSKEDLPLAHRSSMDGYALGAVDSFGASESAPAYLEKAGVIDIERPADFELQPGECAQIVTGGCLPAGADSVVMVEYTQEMGQEQTLVEIRRAVAPWENVMRQGEDVQTGQTVLRAGTKIRVPELGLLSALGEQELSVFLRPRVGIISTGDELVPVHEKPQIGQVRDVNSHTLAALCRSVDARPYIYGLVPDKLEPMQAALKQALNDNDAVFISGGSSVGTRDLTVQAIESLPQAAILAHGVALSPGKPTILARVGGKSVWGLPGQVTSAQVVMMVLGQPFLRYLSGDGQAFSERYKSTRQAVLARNLASKQGREDYVRIKLQTDEQGRLLAVPVLGKSGLLKTLLGSDGLLRIDSDLEGLEQGAPVEVWML